jgi:hypothetical protein
LPSTRWRQGSTAAMSSDRLAATAPSTNASAGAFPHGPQPKIPL